MEDPTQKNIDNLTQSQTLSSHQILPHPPSSFLFIDNTIVNYLILILATIIMFKLIYDVVYNKLSGIGILIDIIFFTVIYVYIIFLYQQVNTKKQTNLLFSFSNEIKRELDDVNTILYVSYSIAVLYVIKFLFLQNNKNMPISISVSTNIAWLYFAILLIVNFFKYILNIPIIDMINTFTSDFFNSSTSHTSSNVSPEIIKSDEVFHISNNLYSYEDAQNICSSYGAKLATYDQIENAYNNGAEWCSYGWSDGQMAFFPTQKNTWEELQKNPNHKNDCGRPGINGGYMDNQKLLFGVNCYGKKPEPTIQQQNMMKIKQQQTTPVKNEKVEFWKENANTMLLVNPFNKQSWSQF
jgi:hypothetical protein